MNVSAKTEYACVAVLELAADYGTGRPVRVRDIAEANGIPAQFLVQILLRLKSAGLVSSTRGAGGGYQLAKPPEAISLAEVMAVTEGAASPPTNNAGRDRPASRALRNVWSEIGVVQQRMLDSTSMADLLERARGYSENMYYI